MLGGISDSINMQLNEQASGVSPRSSRLILNFFFEWTEAINFLLICCKRRASRWSSNISRHRGLFSLIATVFLCAGLRKRKPNWVGSVSTPSFGLCFFVWVALIRFDIDDFVKKKT